MSMDLVFFEFISSLGFIELLEFIYLSFIKSWMFLVNVYFTSLAHFLFSGIPVTYMFELFDKISLKSIKLCSSFQFFPLFFRVYNLY